MTFRLRICNAAVSKLTVNLTQNEIVGSTAKGKENEK